MSDLGYAFVIGIAGGIAGGLTTAIIALIAAIRTWGERGEQIAELRRTVEQLDRDGDDLEQRVRSVKETVDQHIGEVRGHSMCTSSES